MNQLFQELICIRRFITVKSVPVDDVLLGGPDEERELGGLLDVDVLVEDVGDPGHVVDAGHAGILRIGVGVVGIAGVAPAKLHVDPWRRMVKVLLSTQLIGVPPLYGWCM